nr:uncharacterized protein LOC117993767 isoform X2 [Maniola hyperantus]
MLTVLVLSVSLSILGSDAAVNEMIAAGQQTIPQNFIPPSLNFNTEKKGSPNIPVNEMAAAGQPTIPQNFIPPSLNSNTENKGFPNIPINEVVAAGQPTIPQNFIPPSLNFNTENKGTLNNPPPIQFQVVDNPQNGAYCPNAAILLNILNMLTSSLPQDNNSILDPDKFKYVLTVVKNFLETTPLNPENLELYNRLKYLDAIVDKIKENPSLRELDGTTSKTSPPYDLPAQRNLNCQALFNNLINFINTAYAQVLRYCLQTGKCNANNGLNIPSNYNGIYQLNPYGLIQRNSTTKIWPFYDLPKESITAGADLVNFIKSQEGKGIHDMMSILKNYRPSGATNVPDNELKSPNDIQNPFLHMNPKNVQIPSLYQPMNGMNGKNPNLQPSNIYYPPNVNTMPWQIIFSGLKLLPQYTYPKNSRIPSLYQPMNEMNGKNPNLQPSKIYYPPNMNMPWQTIFSGLKGLSGNAYLQLLKKFYERNNLGTTSSIYPGMETPLQLINGQIIPINTGIPNTNPNEIVKLNPSFDNDPNHLIDILKRVPNQQQNLLNTNIKITQAEINKIPNFVDNTPLANIYQYLQYLQNLNIRPSMPQNILPQKPTFPQQSSNYVAYNQNQVQNPPTVGVYNQLLNQSGLGFNQMSPFSTAYYNTKDNNGQNMFTDNTKQGNYGGQLLDFNSLLGVANQGKLNNVPIKNGIIELTYALKKPKPEYESQYYVKYRLPYQTFLYNLQNLLVKKPYLRNEPNGLYQELLVGSNVTDTSNDLKGLNHEDIVKLTTTNGTLVTAKLLHNNDTTVDEILKVVQRLNSKLPVETIIDFNKNATKNINLETQQNNVNGTKTSGVNNLSKNVYPTFSDVQRRIYPNSNYPYSSIGQYPQRFQYNAYSAYQTNPGLLNVGMPFLKYGNVLPNTKYNLNNPTLYLL